MKVSLNPQLVPKATLQSKKTIPSFSEGSTYIALSIQSDPEYSFVTELEKIEVADSYSETPLLIANKNKVGKLPKGTNLELFPYHIPDATEITIALSEEYQIITSGDWTASIKDHILNHIYDVGDSCKIPLNIDDKILILRGNFLNSHPQAPIRICSTTKILVKKFSKEDIEQKLKEIEEEKANRTQRLFKEVMGDIIANILDSNPDPPQVALNLDLSSVSADLMDKEILGLFPTYTLYDTEKNEESKNKFILTRTFHKQLTADQHELILYRQVVTKKTLNLLIECYFPDSKEAQQYTERLREDIYQLQMSLKENFSKKERFSLISTFILEQGGEFQLKGEDQVPLSALLPNIQKNFPDWDLDQKEISKILRKMVKQGLVDGFEKLNSGFFMIRFFPAELTQDPTIILSYGRDQGKILREDLMLRLGWPEYRIDKALQFLVSRNMVKEKHSYREGTIYFFY